MPDDIYSCDLLCGCPDCHITMVCNEQLGFDEIKHFDENGELLYQGPGSKWREDESPCMDGHRLEMSKDMHADFVAYVKSRKIEPVNERLH